LMPNAAAHRGKTLPGTSRGRVPAQAGTHNNASGLT
jgi:hypothetical protein